MPPLRRPRRHRTRSLFRHRTPNRERPRYPLRAAATHRGMRRTHPSLLHSHHCPRESDPPTVHDRAISNVANSRSRSRHTLDMIPRDMRQVIAFNPPGACCNGMLLALLGVYRTCYSPPQVPYFFFLRMRSESSYSSSPRRCMCAESCW